MNERVDNQQILTKEDERLIRQLQALIEDEPDRIANLANASALLKQHLNDVNWLGFYLPDANTLVLGPFQGLPACVRIPAGEGVCGTAAKENQTIRVKDVHAFPGHIACDTASESEIVVPINKNDEFVGVLDIDSPNQNRFSEDDEYFLEQFTATLSAYLT